MSAHKVGAIVSGVLVALLALAGCKGDKSNLGTIPASSTSPAVPALAPPAGSPITVTQTVTVTAPPPTPTTVANTTTETTTTTVTETRSGPGSP
jgi:hypothetical protein